ncbi:hypothetical protein CONLIGDRAFT_715761 [Coniochaeta ligniaria NRRL 30616]|uniref:Uncharacterized protein n=1 Tax=Coniochaeta ligniaria NRRL 30616 TaxID=1408157 RepID=A0A1J7JDC5_9PEZI|nr:hypothetical protein CONLIGDRAFT_715761 [Coniochaeta ligniaria NRRL 30616]
MHTPTPSAWLFASDVAQRLRDNARELSKVTGIKAFCSALESELAIIAQHFDDVGVVESDTGVGEPRLVKLLENLERLCQWPSRPGLFSRQGKTFDSRRYPALTQLLEDRTETKKAMRNFASDYRAKKHRESLLKLLDAFVKVKPGPTGPELSELEPTDTRDHEDYQASIRALYASLASHCQCPRGDGRKEITANLRLNNCCSPGEVDNSVKFRLFFLDHPHLHDADETCHWQDAQVYVFRKRGIKLKADQVSGTNAYAGRMISMDEFCEIITNRKRTQLELAVSDGILALRGAGRLSQDFLLSASSISLAKLLDGAKLSRKMKLLLSYFLAKAVWQFYDSDWMRNEWTKETVHFMLSRTTENGIFVNEPFLSARFDDCHPHRGAHDEFRSHMFPKILALGIMLLEIELAVKIEDYRMPEDRTPDAEPNVNADHFAAEEVFNKTELWEKKETFSVFKDIVKVCLFPDEFMPFSTDVQALRNALRKRVVNPLEALYKSAWDNPDTSIVRAVELEMLGLSFPEHIAGTPSTSHVPRSPLLPPTPLPLTTSHRTPAYSPPVTYLEPQAYSHQISLPSVSPPPAPLPDGIMSTGGRGVTSDDWFSELDRLNLVLRPKPKDKDSIYQPVKIAILDTGVHEDYADSVKSYKDFVNRDDDNWQDNTGHGTNAVRLIQKVYHMAEIYVGRVFDGPLATDNTAALMAEAVRHATNTWNVDIIVIPSGFKSDDSDLEDAIDEARNVPHRALVFAAASNYGNVGGIAFPGRLYINLKLFCMFSTDPKVRAFPSFNPSASSTARYSFAILGENVSLPNQEGFLSGTSYATMIAAGVAGRILDFSRQKDSRANIRRIDKLRTVEGMSAVFETMVKGAVDNGYHCMRPWSILPPEVRGEDQPSKRLRGRAHICETISRALEDMSTR